MAKEIYQKWFIKIADKLSGPYTQQEIQKLLSEGKILETSPVTHDPNINPSKTVQELLSPTSSDPVYSLFNALQFARNKPGSSSGLTKQDFSTAPPPKSSSNLQMTLAFGVGMMLLFGYFALNRNSDHAASTTSPPVASFQEKGQDKGQNKAPFEHLNSPTKTADAAPIKPMESLPAAKLGVEKSLELPKPVELSPSRVAETKPRKPSSTNEAFFGKNSKARSRPSMHSDERSAEEKPLWEYASEPPQERPLEAGPESLSEMSDKTFETNLEQLDAEELNSSPLAGKPAHISKKAMSLELERTPSSIKPENAPESDPAVQPELNHNPAE